MAALLGVSGLAIGCGGEGGGSNPAAPAPAAANPVCARIETTATSLNPRVGETSHVGATAFDTTGKQMTGGVTFSSSNPAVATVNAATGDVTAVSAGNVVITATCTTGGPPAPTATVAMTIRPSAVSLILQKAGQGDGFLTSSPAGTQFDDGTNVTVTASPNANSTFTGWGGACGGNGACNVVIRAPGPVTVIANFGLYTFNGAVDTTMTTSRPSVGCTWSSRLRLNVAMQFAIGVGNVPSGNATITGTMTATVTGGGGACFGQTDNINVQLPLGGTTGAMTFSGVIDNPGSGNSYRTTFNGSYDPVGRSVSGTMQFTYGGFDGQGQGNANLAAR